jgi:hypothetical protein
MFFVLLLCHPELNYSMKVKCKQWTPNLVEMCEVNYDTKGGDVELENF